MEQSKMKHKKAPMFQVTIGMFFFGLLSLCLEIAGLSLLGLHIVVFHNPLNWRIILAIFALVLMSGLQGFLIYQYRKNIR